MSGRGLMRGVPREWPWERLFDIPPWTGDETSTALAVDWYLAGRGAITPTRIPWTWLSGPIRFRQDSPLNAAAVSRSGGVTGYASDETSIDNYGQWPFTVTTESVDDLDAQHLADWVVAYYANPRIRCPQLTLNLRARTQTECWRVLDREIGDPITITGVPAGWPEGANTLVIEGISHAANSDMRTVTWSAAPVVGSSPDVTGPWFRLGVSAIGGSDALPF